MSHFPANTLHSPLSRPRSRGEGNPLESGPGSQAPRLPLPPGGAPLAAGGGAGFRNTGGMEAVG